MRPTTFGFVPGVAWIRTIHEATRSRTNKTLPFVCLRGSFWLGKDVFQNRTPLLLFDLSPSCAIIRAYPPAGYFPRLVQANELFSEKGCVMLVNWKKDVDAALAEAKAQKKPLLIDFSAAPA